MRKPITAESLRATRPHTHTAANAITAADGSLHEICECGCCRIVRFTDGRRLPGSWT